MPAYPTSDIADLFKEWYYQIETYECNLDIIQDQGIDKYTEFYCCNGIWEQVQEQAHFELDIMNMANPKSIILCRPLRQALEKLEAFDASLGSRDITETQAKKRYDLEYKLVKELLTFFDDPEQFVIAHIMDTSYEHSEAWLIFDRYEGAPALELLKPYRLKELSA